MFGSVAVFRGQSSLIHSGHKRCKAYKLAGDWMGCENSNRLEEYTPLLCILLYILRTLRVTGLGFCGTRTSRSILFLLFLCTSSLYFFCISLPRNALGVRITRLPASRNHSIGERIAARMSSRVSAWAEVVSESECSAAAECASCLLSSKLTLYILQSPPVLLWLLPCCSLTAPLSSQESEFYDRRRALSLENIRLVSASTCAQASSSAAQSQQPSNERQRLRESSHCVGAHDMRAQFWTVENWETREWL